MQLREIEPGLSVYECPASGGLWIPLRSYLAWREQQPQGTSAPSQIVPPEVEDDSKQRALICPESGRLLLRYRVGHGLKFHIDRSPVTGGVWLDKGEWEALKSKGLHVALNLIFTSAYQQQARSEDYAEKLTQTFRERFGAANFAKAEEFGTWLVANPKGRDICSYLLDRLEHETGPNARKKGV